MRSQKSPVALLELCSAQPPAAAKRQCVQKSHPSELIPPSSRGWDHTHLCSGYSLISKQTLKFPPGVPLNGKLERQGKTLRCSHFFGRGGEQPDWLRLKVCSRRAHLQGTAVSLQSLGIWWRLDSQEGGCGFPSSFSMLKLYFVLLLLSVIRLQFLLLKHFFLYTYSQHEKLCQL